MTLEEVADLIKDHPTVPEWVWRLLTEDPEFYLPDRVLALAEKLKARYEDSASMHPYEAWKLVGALLAPAKTPKEKQ